MSEREARTREEFRAERAEREATMHMEERQKEADFGLRMRKELDEARALLLDVVEAASDVYEEDAAAARESFQEHGPNARPWDDDRWRESDPQADELIALRDALAAYRAAREKGVIWPEVRVAKAGLADCRIAQVFGYCAACGEVQRARTADTEAPEQGGKEG